MEGFTYWYYESEKALQSLNTFVESYIPKTAVELFFEDESDDDKTDDIKTSKAPEQANNVFAGKVKKVIEAIKNMIKNIGKSISDMVKKFFMSKEEKAKFEEWKQLMSQNPELKNKKLRVADFRKINAEYQSIIKEIDQEIERAESLTDEKAKENAEKIKNKVYSTAKSVRDGAGAVFALDAALRFAENNRDIAKQINKMLESENGMIEKIEQAVGDKRAKDFQRKIKSSTRKLSLHRLKVWALGQYVGTTSGALDRTVQDFKDIFSANPGNVIKQKRIIDDTMGAVNQVKNNINPNAKDITYGRIIRKAIRIGKNAASEAINERRMEKKKAQREEEQKQSLRRLFT